MTASASGTKVPKSANNNKNLAVRRCMFCYTNQNPKWAKDRTESTVGASRGGLDGFPKVPHFSRQKWGTQGPSICGTSRSSKRIGYGSGFAVDFGPPPADADEEEPPIAEEFRRLAFEGVADELENPSDHE